MFNQISWTTYLLSVTTVTAVYYFWVVVRFFRTELTAFCSKKPAIGVLSSSDIAPITADIIGPVSEVPERSQHMEELTFGEADPDDGPDDQPAAVTTVPLALGTELEALISVISETKESKETFLMLFGLLAEKHANLIGDDQQREISDTLISCAERFSFELSIEDLNSQWQLLETL